MFKYYKSIMFTPTILSDTSQQGVSTKKYFPTKASFKLWRYCINILGIESHDFLNPMQIEEAIGEATMNFKRNYQKFIKASRLGQRVYTSALTSSTNDIWLEVQKAH